MFHLVLPDAVHSDSERFVVVTVTVVAQVSHG